MDRDTFHDYYGDLGLQPGAAPNSIKNAFHTLAKQHHPDRSGHNDSTAFRAAREAYEKLSDATFKSAYDRTYWHSKLQPDTDATENDSLRPTRTAQYEAEERARAASPLPYKPVRRPNELSWVYTNSKAYRKSEYGLMDRRNYMDEQRSGSRSGSMAHGLHVRMTAHPAAQQNCQCRIDQWRAQSGGLDFCVFCMRSHINGCRCPGCEALACAACLQEISAKERDMFGTLGSR
ncbi:hypothetical protein ACN47E_009654 [Coniothyrium glycines]